MRLWSIHPEYLDAKGLVALWQEGLLAQKVLLGETTGYKNHPQLNRFKNSSNSLGAIACYLRCVEKEAKKRGYKFNSKKIINKRIKTKLLVSDGQVEYEFNHLLSKLKNRNPISFIKLNNIKSIKLHPLFKKNKGGIEVWEVID